MNRLATDKLHYEDIRSRPCQILPRIPACPNGGLYGLAVGSVTPSVRTPYPRFETWHPICRAAERRRSDLRSRHILTLRWKIFFNLKSAGCRSPAGEHEPANSSIFREASSFFMRRFLDRVDLFKGETPSTGRRALVCSAFYIPTHRGGGNNALYPDPRGRPAIHRAREDFRAPGASSKSNSRSLQQLHFIRRVSHSNLVTIPRLIFNDTNAGIRIFATTTTTSGNTPGRLRYAPERHLVTT